MIADLYFALDQMRSTLDDVFADPRFAGPRLDADLGTTRDELREWMRRFNSMDLAGEIPSEIKRPISDLTLGIVDSLCSSRSDKVSEVWRHAAEVWKLVDAGRYESYKVTAEMLYGVVGPR